MQWLVALVLYLVEASIVLELTDESYEKSIDLFNPMFVLAYASWDSHCLEILQAFESIANEYAISKPSLTFSKIDMATYSNATLAVRGYPTYLLHENGFSRKYSGPLTYRALEAWFSNISPLYVIHSQEEWDAFYSKVDTFVALALVSDLESNDRAIMEAVAAQDDGVLAVSDAFDKDFQSELWLYDPILDTRTKYAGVWTVDSIQRFLQTNRREWLQPYDGSRALDPSFPSYTLLFIDDTSSYHKQFLHIALSVAKRSCYTQFLLVAKTNDMLLSYFDVETPAIVWYVNPTTTMKYPLDGQQLESAMSFDSAAFESNWTTFQGEVSSPDGRTIEIFLEPTIQLESNPIVEISTLSKLRELQQEERPILVVLYSHRCPSCQMLLPIFERVAAHFLSPIFAKLDADVIQYQELVQVVGKFSLPSVYLMGTPTEDIVKWEGYDTATYESLMAFCSTHV